MSLSTSKNQGLSKKDQHSISIFPRQEHTAGDFPPLFNALIVPSKKKAKQKTHQQTFPIEFYNEILQLYTKKIKKTTPCLLSICGLEFKKVTQQ